MIGRIIECLGDFLKRSSFSGILYNFLEGITDFFSLKKSISPLKLLPNLVYPTLGTSTGTRGCGLGEKRTTTLYLSLSFFLSFLSFSPFCYYILALAPRTILLKILTWNKAGYSIEMTAIVGGVHLLLNNCQEQQSMSILLQSYRDLWWINSSNHSLIHQLINEST